MPNYYTQYSEIITDLTPEEKAWCERALGILILWCDQHDVELPGLALGQNPDQIQIISDEGSNLELTVDCLQAFLFRWRPTEIVMLQWANTCDRPVPGAYGGGALVFDANEARWLATGNWAAEQAKALRQGLPEITAEEQETI